MARGIGGTLLEGDNIFRAHGKLRRQARRLMRRRDLLLLALQFGRGFGDLTKRLRDLAEGATGGRDESAECAGIELGAA